MAKQQQQLLTTDVLVMDETVKKSVAASIGAVLTSFVVTPLEVVKTRLQVQVPNVVKVPPAVQKTNFFSVCDSMRYTNQCSHYNFSNGLTDTMLPKETLLKKCKCSAAQLSSAPKPNSVFYTMARIVRLEGPLALYSGLPPTLLFAVPSTAMYFTSYEMILSECKELFPSVNHGALAMVSGGIARAGAATVFSPLELIRVQMQSGESAHSFLTHVRQVANGGVRQLYRGLGATLARDIPFSALYWFGIETSKEYLSERVGIKDAQQRKVAVALLSGVIAGTFATVATHPFDVVKTRAQVSIYSSEPTTSSSNNSNKALSSLQMLRQVWRQEGLVGLSAGLVPRVAKVAPACAIMIGTYEAAKLAFDQQQERQQGQHESSL